MIRRRTAMTIAFAVLGVAVVVPRLPALGALGLMQYNWFGRVEKFIAAIGDGRFADTYQAPHPGVTLMWLTGGVLAAAQWFYGPIAGRERVWFFELTQVIWALVLLALLFVVLRRTLVVYGERPEHADWIALVPCVLIAIDPLVITMTRAVSLDGPLGLHALLAVCLFLIAVRTRALADELFAGVAAGITVLTKMPGLIFLFGMGLWLLVRALRERHDPHARRSLRSVLVVPAVAAATTVILWPALWVAPGRTLIQMAATREQVAQIERGDLGSLLAARPDRHGFDALLDVILHPHKANNADVLYGRLRAAWQYYPAVVLFKTPPVTLVLAAVGAALSISAWRRRSTNATLAVLGYSLLFGLLYFTCMSIAAKKTWRYMVTVEVFLELAAGLTFAWLAQAAIRRQRYWVPAALAAPLLLQSVDVLAHEPYFLTYYNPLLGGRAVAEQYVMIEWGDGIGEAARYMSEHARNRPVRFIATGTITPRLRIMIGDAHYVGRPSDAEFLVIDYRQFLQADFSPLARAYWKTRRPEHVVWIRGVPRMWIYRMDQGAGGTL